jgi:RNA polymerase sigma-70 factor (ECF subfamily)
MMDHARTPPAEDEFTTALRDHYAGQPDDALLAQVAAGDELALREIYERHARWIGTRLRRTLPVHAVEDVLQETFLAVWRGAARYGGTGEVGGWLWGIARRQAALWARSHGRPELALDDIAEPRSHHSGDPAQIAVARTELGQAFAALGPAGSAPRELARQVFIEDRPLTDIAHELGVPHGTVKRRVHTLRRKMWASLGKETGQ